MKHTTWRACALMLQAVISRPSSSRMHWQRPRGEHAQNSMHWYAPVSALMPQAVTSQPSSSRTHWQEQRVKLAVVCASLYPSIQ
eukprot:scaffold93484_cov26-Tisochrysis_lutea.AAC.1